LLIKGCSKVKCKKEKENKFLFPLAERKTLLTFATPNRTKGSTCQTENSRPGFKSQPLKSKQKSFGRKKKNAELWQP